jgi:AcrR family transcriptional regulator
MTPAEAAKLGRKRDHTRDPEILTAALDVLAETGYEGMTIDMVAARAKAGKATLYRRWSSKAELVIDAVACLKPAAFENGPLPDTGTLRGDLIGLLKPPGAISNTARHLSITIGLISMLTREPELAQAARAAFIEPRAANYRALLQRAVDRGEISADCDLEAVINLGPAMTLYRVLILQQPVDRDFLISLIDGVVLPAVGLGRPSSPEGRPGTESWPGADD